MREIVLAPDFLDGQLPVDRAARAGHAAQHQRLQPARDQRDPRQHLGQLLVAVLQGAAVGRHGHGPPPDHRRRQIHELPAGGRGYTRPPSLVSLWSTAPFLLNNTVGPFDPSPSVEARMRSFEPRSSRCSGPSGARRTPSSATRCPAWSSTAPRRAATSRSRRAILPDLLAAAAQAFRDELRSFIGAATSRSARFPKGVPVNLVANIDLRRRWACRPVAARRTKLRRRTWSSGRPRPASSPRTPGRRLRAAFADLVEPMLELSKCPDFVVNRGHYFGTD